MTHFKPATGYSAIAQVEAYWHALRGNRQMPKRSEIDPRGIEDALESTFIVERIAPGVARLRIAGSALNTLMGMEVRGMPITSFFLPSARREISDAIEEVFQRPAIGSLRLTSAGDAQNKTLTGRMILLPLKSDLGDVSRVLGCLVAPGDVGTGPRRFEITTQQIVSIESPAGGYPQHLSGQTTGAQTPSAQDTDTGFSEPDTTFGTTNRPKRPPYLRLVKSDD